MPAMTGQPLREKALNFGEAEQALLVGHAFPPGA
ncbi:Aerobactin synthase IucA [Citrobacter koseri]|nr:Aerobactin synthase IucA [Citrobacter koseri]